MPDSVPPANFPILSQKATRTVFTSLKNPLRVLTPIVLTGMLLVTACSANTAVDASTGTAAVSEEASLTVGTGITSMDDVQWGLIDSADPEFNSAVEDLVLELNAASPGGLREVNINAHGPELVGINLLTDSEDGTISASQVTAMVDVLAAWEPPTPVTKFEIGGFNQNFGKGEILTGAADAGINPELLESMWGKIVIPAEGIDQVYA